MPKKIRKMLGDVFAPSTVALRELIDTQSRDTIRKWWLDYAESKMLPIFEKHCPNDERPRGAIEAARDYIDGKVKFTVVKNIILNECHAAARELKDHPVAQAAARAVGQGSAVVHTLSHSLGLYFYAAAAIAYDRIGLDATAEEYAAIAEEVCLDYTEALRAFAVENEPNPAKIKWGCWFHYEKLLVKAFKNRRTMQDGGKLSALFGGMIFGMMTAQQRRINSTIERIYT